MVSARFPIKQSFVQIATCQRHHPVGCCAVLGRLALAGWLAGRAAELGLLA